MFYNTNICSKNKSCSSERFWIIVSILMFMGSLIFATLAILWSTGTININVFDTIAAASSRGIGGTDGGSMVGVVCPVPEAAIYSSDGSVPKTLNNNNNTTIVTYHPGNLIESIHYPGLMISEGLSCKAIANSGERVRYCQAHIDKDDESSKFWRPRREGRRLQSDERFHTYPDGAGVFVDTRPWNVGGWIYVSNSENEAPNGGGVGAITFNMHGQIVNFQHLIKPATFTETNCGGGKTPWNTWITCEEHSNGQCWQVDPTGKYVAEQTQLGGIEGGEFESVAVDNRIQTRPIFFVTEDHDKGALRRYTPPPLVPTLNDISSNIGDHNGNITTTTGDVNGKVPHQLHEYTTNKDIMWNMLHMEGGKMEYLIFDEDSHTKNEEYDGHFGIFEWTHNKTLGEESAKDYYPGTEGIDFIIDKQNGDGILYFISKKKKRIFRLNLNKQTYESYTTKKGTFTGQPDQIKSIVGDNGILYTYFTEDSNGNKNKPNGIHGRDKYHRTFTILEGKGHKCNDDDDDRNNDDDDDNSDSIYVSETTGLAFSPNHIHMYVAFQSEGILFDCTREDGLSFKGRTIDMRYHKT